MGLEWIGLDWSVEGEEKIRKKRKKTGELRSRALLFVHSCIHPCESGVGDERERRILAHIKRDQ